MTQKKYLLFWVENKVKLLWLSGLYLIACLSIGLANYPYIDDIARRVEGSTDFAKHYARYFSEFASWTVQGSSHLTDLGLTTHILNALIMSLASAIVLFVLFDGQKISWASTIASLFIGINPWFLEALSFRFDGPYMALSVLVSVIPLLFYKSSSRLRYFLASALGIFLMCNSYQASSGIYIVFLMTLVYQDLLADKEVKQTVEKIIISVAAYGFAMLAYLLQMKLNPQLNERGDTTKIAGLSDIPNAIIENTRVYFETLREQTATVWFFLFIVITVIFIIQSIRNAKLNKPFAVGLTIVYLYLGAILSFGVYLAMTTALADDRPRYIYGFAFFLSMIFIIAGSYVKNKWVNLLKSSIIFLLVYYIFSFTFAYSSTLVHQKEAFERQSTLLAGDLNDFINSENHTVYVNRLFNNSAVYYNSLKNYPILDDLVPNNSAVYWPNVMWFNTLVQMDVSFVAFDFNTVDTNVMERVVSNYHYDIYLQDNQLFIYMK